MTDAELCRRRGWTAGTRLVGEDGHVETVIRITAVGERLVLAVVEESDGHPGDDREFLWSLHHRQWREVPA